MPENTSFKTSLAKAMALCSSRELCCSDIRRKTELWGLNSHDTEKVINTLKMEKYIDEKRYAAAFVKDKFNYGKWGKIKITAHLRYKKIPEEIIKSTLSTIDNELYKNTIKDLLSDHSRHIKAKNLYDLKGKLLRYGLSKGFERDLLFDIINTNY